MTLLVSAFPGVGKSYATKVLATNGYEVRDSDSSHHHKDGFPYNYVAHILANSQSLNPKVDVQFISSHLEVRKHLEAIGLRYVLVYPVASAKEEYLERYRQRGSPQEFVALMDKNWLSFLESCKDSGMLSIELQEHQYMEHALDAMAQLNLINL